MRRPRWLVRPVRAVALAALAGASAILLVLHPQQAPPMRLEPLPAALGCVLVGWLVLRETLAAARKGGGEPSVLPPLARAGAAMAVGAGAGALALLSRAPVAWLGVPGDATGYVLCALGGLFAGYALAGTTILQAGLAACAWLAVVSSQTASDGPHLPAMLAVFLISAATAAWPRKRADAGCESDNEGQQKGKGRERQRKRGPGA